MEFGHSELSVSLLSDFEFGNSELILFSWYIGKSKLILLLKFGYSEHKLN